MAWHLPDGSGVAQCDGGELRDRWCGISLRHVQCAYDGCRGVLVDRAVPFHDPRAARTVHLLLVLRSTPMGARAGRRVVDERLCRGAARPNARLDRAGRVYARLWCDSPRRIIASPPRTTVGAWKEG